MAFPSSWPYTIANSTTPDADEVMANFNSITSYFTGKTGGQLFIANASGTVVATTMSGDATMSNAGVLTLSADSVGANEIAANSIGNSEMANDAIGNAEMAANAVDTAEIVNGAVTSAKVDLSYLQDEDHDLVLDGTYASGASVSLTAGTWLLIGSAVVNNANPLSGNIDLYARFAVGGTGIWERQATNVAQGNTLSASWPWVTAVGSTTVVAVQAKRGGSGVGALDSNIVAVRIA